MCHLIIKVAHTTSPDVVLQNSPPVRNFVRFKVGNEHRISFWKDIWLGETSLKDVFHDIFTLSLMKDAMVEECRNDT